MSANFHLILQGSYREEHFKIRTKKLSKANIESHYKPGTKETGKKIKASLI